MAERITFAIVQAASGREASGLGLGGVGMILAFDAGWDVEDAPAQLGHGGEVAGRGGRSSVEARRALEPRMAQQRMERERSVVLGRMFAEGGDG
jgi:hypothetical protein